MPVVAEALPTPFELMGCALIVAGIYQLNTPACLPRLHRPGPGAPRVTLLKNAVAGLGLKAFPFGGGQATTGVRPGLGTLPLVGGVSHSYEQMYRGQLWLNVDINKLARGIGRLPLKTSALGADGERLRQRDGWLAESLARPMPRKPPFAWKQAIVGNICVYGNAVVVKVRPVPGKPPTELWTSSFRFWEVGAGRGVRLPRGRGPTARLRARGRPALQVVGHRQRPRRLLADGASAPHAHDRGRGPAPHGRLLR